MKTYRAIREFNYHTLSNLAAFVVLDLSSGHGKSIKVYDIDDLSSEKVAAIWESL